MMLGSPILGTAVGLTLLFATAALLCSAITESVSNVFQLRAKYLLTGLRAMLDGPETAEQTFTRKDVDKQLHEDVKNPRATEEAAAAVLAGKVDERYPQLTTALFDSPLLTSLQSRRITPFRKGTLRNPQYLSGRTFARALVDMLVPATPGGNPPIDLDISVIRDAVAKLPHRLPLRRQLLAFLSTGGTDVKAFERVLEQWYDEEMAKISGWYKRWARVALGIVGFAVAAAVNLDTLEVAHSLYTDGPVQQAVIDTASTGTLCQNSTDQATRNQCAADELTTLKASGLPIGWPDAAAHDSPGVMLKILGWAITAFAVSFGAPFWFEALSKLGSLRNTGTRPDDK